LVCANSRSVQKRFEHFGKAVGLLDNRLQPTLSTVRIAAIDLALRHLGGRAHHGDRITQIVDRHRHELFGFGGLRPGIACHLSHLRRRSLQVADQDARRS
jgi:hypothetical protein